MQEPSMPFMEEIPIIKPRKKASKGKNSLIQLQAVDSLGFLPEQGTPLVKPRKKAKSSKRNVKNKVSPMQQLSERSNSDSLPDSSSPGNDYRALRRKYLILEEESCTLGNDLRVIETEVRTLEDEKFVLLDQLLVLEGLIDPSELQSLEQR